MSDIARFLEDGQIELLDATYFKKFLERFKRWELKNGADNLVLEDNAKLSNEVNTILSGKLLNKREQIPQEREINRQFGLFHRFVIGKLQNDKSKRETDEELQTSPSILECGKLQIDIDTYNLIWEGVVYSNINLKLRSVTLLIILLKQKEELVRYSDIIESIDKNLSPLDDALTAQQYKAELVNDLVRCKVPMQI